MAIIRVTQVAIGDMRVDLRRRDVAVAQQRLHRSGIRAALQQVRSKAVAQRMRRNVFQSCFGSVTLNRDPDEVCCQWAPSAREQVKRIRVAVRRSYCCVLLQPVNCTLAYGHTPLLAPFSVTKNQASVNIRLSRSQ